MKKTLAELNNWVSLLLMLGILLGINIASSYIRFTIDLTEEKRYTLTKATVEVLKEIQGPVYAEVMLGGNFPAGFKRLQRATLEMLQDFRRQNPYLEYSFTDPNDGSPEQIAQLRENLAKEDVFPTNLRIKEQGETVEKLIYPYVIFTYAGRRVPVNLLESEVPGMPPELILNNSIALLEYKLITAIQRLNRTTLPNVVFLKGHGELSPEQTVDFRRDLRTFHSFAFLELDSVFRINPAVDLLVIAKPRGPFSEPDKFKIDQFVMQGGKVLWLIDPLHVSLDSLRPRGSYIPLEYDLNLDDLLFKYGVRVQRNLVLDLECSSIPMAVGMIGDRPQFDLLPWFYHPVVVPRSDHPMVKNLGPIHFEFPATIDTIKTKTDVTKTLVLQTSPHTRLQYPPVQLSFEILRYDPDPSKFDKGEQTLGVLLEGTFASNYENRVPQAFLDSLDALGEPFKAQSKPTAMIVISDGDVIRNPWNPTTQEARPLGFNPYDRRQYANKDLALNMVEYLLDNRGLIAARSREVKLRLLDKVRTKEEKRYWQILNIGGPIIILLLTGLLYSYWRKRKYAIQAKKES
jgi:ABC-2 type transport system permease protein